jgi:hypothetical protein
MSANKIIPKSQIEDYKYRGDEFENMNLLQFVKDTYERRSSYVNTLKDTGKDQSQDHEFTEEECSHPYSRIASPGRPSHNKSSYKLGHPSHGKLYRVKRRIGHKTLLEVVGKFFPRADDPENYEWYCACMLATIKPWRNLHDLKSKEATWSDEFNKFMKNADEYTRRIISNMQYYYETKDAALQNTKDKDIRGQKEKRRGMDETNPDDDECQF